MDGLLRDDDKMSLASQCALMLRFVLRKRHETSESERS